EHPRFSEEGWEVVSVPLTGTIEAEQVSTSPSSRIISVRVTLSHKSHLTEIVSLSQNPVISFRVDGKRNAASLMTGNAIIVAADGKQSLLESVSVPPGEQTSTVFTLSLPEPGVYLIQFDPCAGSRLGRSCIIQSHIAVR